MKNIKKYLIFCALFLIISFINVSQIYAMNHSNNITSYPLDYSIGDVFEFNWKDHEIFVEYKSNNIVDFTIDTALLQYELPSGVDFSSFIWILFGDSTDKVYLATGYANSNGYSMGSYIDYSVYLYNYCYSNYCPLTINDEYFSTGGDWLTANKYIHNGSIGISSNMYQFVYDNGWSTISNDNTSGEALVFGGNINFLLWDGSTVDSNIYEPESANYNILQTTNIEKNPFNLQIDPLYISDEQLHEYVYANQITLTVDESIFYMGDKVECSYLDLDGKNTVKTFNGGASVNDSKPIYRWNIYLNTQISCEFKNQAEELIYEQTLNANFMPNLSVIDAISTNLIDESLYAFTVDYRFNAVYFQNDLNLPEYIPFKIMKLENESTTNFISKINFYYLNPNGTKVKTNNISLINYSCEKDSNYSICSGYIKTNQSYTNFEMEILISDLIGDVSVSYYDNLPFNWSFRSTDFLTKTFANYTKHNLNENYIKAYIYKQDTQARDTGSIYFPRGLTNQGTLGIYAKYYNENSYEPLIELSEYTNYYDKFDVDLSNNKIVVIWIDPNNYEKYKNFAYIYAPNDWIVKLKREVHSDFDLTDNDGNSITISEDYNNDFSYKYGLKDFFSSITNYLDGIKQYTVEFTNLIAFFYNNLNDEIKVFLLVSFILLVVASIILLARRK